MKRDRKRILVLRYRFIGDTVLTVPFLRNLRYAEPDAYITWVVAPGSSDVVLGIPYVDELLYWDPVTIHADSRGAHRTFGAKLRFIKELRAEKFDKAYVLKRSLSSALIALFSGARERVGFDTEGRGLLLTKRVPYRHDQHEVANFLDVLRADGVPVRDDHLEFWTTIEEEGVANEILTREGVEPGERLALIHPFAAIPQRGWHLEDFARLAIRLREHGLRVAVLGSPRERGIFDSARHLFGSDCVDLVGKSSLRVTMAILRKATIFVGNDSGIMHLAAAAAIPLVALFGPQSPLKFGPWSERAKILYKKFPCSPCRQKFFTECEPSPRMKPACIEAISVDEVFSTCCELLCRCKDALTVR
jgi:heptosyltransferase-2